MDYSNFYQLSRDFKSRALQVTSEDFNDELPVVYGNYEAEKPLCFTHYMGSKVFDLIETGWVSVFLFSDRIFDAFEENNITGWKKYCAEVYDKKGELINGYSVLSVTGRCGPIDDDKSELIWRDPPVPEGNRYQVRMGMYFDISTWDNSDIFIPENSLAIVVTEKVKEVLDNLKVSNFNIQPVSMIESQVF